MSTGSSNHPSTPPPPPPANPAKGPLRGQTTLAAEIDRWQALADNLAPQIDQAPGLKDQFAQFQTMLTDAKSLRNQLNTLRANTSVALAQRNQLLVDGGDLYARLNLGLQSFHGPQSPRLKEFGLKPRKKRTGRPRGTPDSTRHRRPRSPTPNRAPSPRRPRRPSLRRRGRPRQPSTARGGSARA
jgi:hypothetical protein